MSISAPCVPVCIAWPNMRDDQRRTTLTIELFLYGHIRLMVAVLTIDTDKVFDEIF